MKKVGIIDCGVSNLTSINNAFLYLGFKTEIIRSVDNLAIYSHLVLPGVGTFYQGMHNLKETGMDAMLKRQVEEGVPLLGICLGMQLLAQMGEEFGPTEGLGYLPGEVGKIKPSTPECRLPHIGWNDVQFSQESCLWKDIGQNNSFYFIHSFAYTRIPEENVIGYCEYGGKVVVAVEKENVYGVQFHPEKSQKFGLNLLKNFVELC